MYNIIHVQTQAKRNLIDIRDVIRITGSIVRPKLMHCKVINICALYSANIQEIICLISKILKQEARTILHDTGSSCDVDLSMLYKILPQDDPLLNRNYWRRVLEYWVPRINDTF